MATVIKHPYEVLVRFGQDGTITGSHAKFSTKVLNDDGSLLMAQDGDAEPVSVAGGAGFPLAELVGMIDVAYLKTVDDHIAVIAKRDEDEAAAKVASDAVIADLTAKLATVDTALASAQASHEATKLELQAALKQVVTASAVTV